MSSGYYLISSLVFEKLHPFFIVHYKSGEEEVTSRAVGAQRDNLWDESLEKETDRTGKGSQCLRQRAV